MKAISLQPLTKSLGFCQPLKVMLILSLISVLGPDIQLHFPAALNLKSCFIDVLESLKHLTHLLRVAMQNTPLFESSGK